MSLEYKEILNIVSKEKFYIYGAGKVAKRCYRALQDKKLLNNFQGFVVTRISNSPVNIAVDNLLEIDRIDNSEYVIVAVDYTSFLEIKRHLNELGFTKFYWVYPYLYDFFLGSPIMCSININIDELLRENLTSNWIAACFLALKDKYDSNERGKKIYIKMMREIFGVNVVKKDYERFVTESVRLQKNGYKQEYAIKISSDKKLLLDGAHRIALAVFFHQKKIIADLYDCSIADYRYCYGIDDTNIRVSYNEDGAIENKLNKEELIIIKETLKEMIGATKEEK